MNGSQRNREHSTIEAVLCTELVGVNDLGSSKCRYSRIDYSMACGGQLVWGRLSTQFVSRVHIYKLSQSAINLVLS